MLNKVEQGRTFALSGRRRVRLAPALVMLAAACEARDRLTFPDSGDDIGPVTLIDQPNRNDTTVDAGPELLVDGRTVDPDGVDSVYFLVIGGNQTFDPFRPSPPTDTVRFGFSVSTSGRSGQTMTLQIYGVDLQGNRGTTTSRHITVR